jgi:delta14-sterol reductase
MDWGLLYVMRWESAVGACALGLIYTALAVFSEQPTGKPLALDIFLGRAKNPQYLSGRVDAKMFLYLFGAAMLALNILSFAMHHQRSYATSTNPGLLLHAGLLCWFLFDYLTFERVHLWTYDLFAERVGFKLGWGCLSFYPYFYAIGLWSVIDRPDPGASDLYLVLSAGVFFLGWALSRGANLQKFRFKTEPERRFLGIQPEVLTDGHRSLLCSGFWGLSRHINYLGEVLMASGLALSLGFPSYWVPWLYPLYYVLLLFPRERDDERRCREKYGALWSAYTERVPRRIIPWIY